jgi:hypothetical protein
VGRSLYQLPSSYLVEQGLLTAADLRRACTGPARAPWDRAGVDVTAHARAVADTHAALWAAQTAWRIADAALGAEREAGAKAAKAAHAWVLWLAGLVDDATAAGRAPGVIVPTQRLRRDRPRLSGTTRHLRAIAPDVHRARDVLTAFTSTPSRVDEVAIHLGRLEAAIDREREAIHARKRATAALREAQARLTDAMQAVDRDAARIARADGRPPMGASREVLRREARRRDEADRRRKRMSAAAGEVGVGAEIDA